MDTANGNGTTSKNKIDKLLEPFRDLKEDYCLLHNVATLLSEKFIKTSISHSGINIFEDQDEYPDQWVVVANFKQPLSTATYVLEFDVFTVSAIKFLNNSLIENVLVKSHQTHLVVTVLVWKQHSRASGFRLLSPPDKKRKVESE